MSRNVRLWPVEHLGTSKRSAYVQRGGPDDDEGDEEEDDDDEQDVELRLPAAAAKGVGVEPLDDPADSQGPDDDCWR